LIGVTAFDSLNVTEGYNAVPLAPGASTTHDTESGTAEIRDWTVFAPGYWKGEYYGPADVARMAQNYAYLKPHLTPVHKLGHDKQQIVQSRLKQSLGFPNFGRVEDAGLTPDGCFVIRRMVGIPLDVAAAINAGFLNSGSVELKPSMPDPHDQSKTVKGPIFTAIALLGEEQPALQDKRLTVPKAVFANGQPVPAATEAGPLLKTMADVTKSYSQPAATEPGSFALCFSDYSETPAVDDTKAKLAALGLTPEQVAQICAMFGGTAANLAEATGPTATTMPSSVPSTPAAGAMADTESSPADMPAAFAAFADKMTKCMSDMTQRVGAVEKFAEGLVGEKEKATEATMSAELDGIFAKHNGQRKLAPNVWKVKRRLMLDAAKSKEFAAESDRTKLFSDFAEELATLPVSHMIDATASTTPAAKNAPLSTFARKALRPNGPIARQFGDTAKRLRTGT
jgi:hypothetical protein